MLIDNPRSPYLQCVEKRYRYLNLYPYYTAAEAYINITYAPHINIQIINNINK